MAASRLRSSSASGSLCLSASSRLSRDNLEVHRMLKLRESSYICEEQSTCKHGLRQLGGRLLIRQLASRVPPGSRGAELVGPGARCSKLTTKDLADALNAGDLKLILIKGIVKFKMVFGIDQGRCQGCEEIFTEALLALFPRATRQRIAIIVLTRPGYTRWISMNKNHSLMRSTLHGLKITKFYYKVCKKISPMRQ